MKSSCVPVIFDTNSILNKRVGLKHLNHVELHRFGVCGNLSKPT